MPDQEAVTAFSFARFAEAMLSMLSSLVCSVRKEEVFKHIPFFIEISDDVDDLVNIRGLIGKQILFSTKQELEVANIQHFVHQRALKLSSNRKDDAEVLEKHTYCLTKFHHEGKFLKINEARKHIPLDKYYIDPINWV